MPRRRRAPRVRHGRLSYEAKERQLLLASLSSQIALLIHRRPRWEAEFQAFQGGRVWDTTSYDFETCFIEVPENSGDGGSKNSSSSHWPEDQAAPVDEVQLLQHQLDQLHAQTWCAYHLRPYLFDEVFVTPEVLQSKTRSLQSVVMREEPVPTSLPV